MLWKRRAIYQSVFLLSLGGVFPAGGLISARAEDRPPWTEISVQEKGDEFDVVGVAIGSATELSDLRIKTIEAARKELQTQFPDKQLEGIPLHTKMTWESEPNEEGGQIKVYRLFHVSRAEVNAYLAKRSEKDEEEKKKEAERKLASISEHEMKHELPWSSGLTVGYESLLERKPYLGYMTLGLNVERRIFGIFGIRGNISYCAVPQTSTFRDEVMGARADAGPVIYPIYNSRFAIGLSPQVGYIVLGDHVANRKSLLLEMQYFFTGVSTGGVSATLNYTDLGDLNKFLGPRSVGGVLQFFGRF